MSPVRGTDVSSYQGGDQTHAFGDFLFVKATEGTGYVNPSHDRQVATARRAGKVIGHYHFLQPGSPVAQARFFVANAKPRHGDLLACDWETSASVADKDAFLAEVKRLCPVNRDGLYESKSYKTSRDDGRDGDFLWVADYGVTSPGIPFTFWQYSDKSPTGGDANTSRFANLAALKAWADFNEKVNPKPAPKPPAKKAAPPTHPVINTARIDLNKALRNNKKPSPIRRALLAALKAIHGIR